MSNIFSICYSYHYLVLLLLLSITSLAHADQRSGEFHHTTGRRERERGHAQRGVRAGTLTLFIVLLLILSSLLVLLSVGGTPPPSTLGSACIHLLHSLPRYGSGGTSLGVINPGNSADLTSNENYALGIAVPVGVALGLGVLTWLVCWGFCCGRCCCNSCGGRAATQFYTLKQQTCLKVGIVVLGCCFITLFFLGLISNAAISASIDRSFTDSDSLVNYLYTFNTPISLMAATAEDALLQAQNLNSTVLAPLPNNSTANAYTACSALLYSLTQSEVVLLSQVAPITSNSNGAPSSSASLSTLSSLLSTTQSQMSSLPINLNHDGQELVTYSNSLISLLPSPSLSAGVTPTTSQYTAQTQFKTASAAAQQIPNFNTLASAVSPSSITNFQSPLSSLNQSMATSPVSALQNLYSLINSSSTSASTTRLLMNFNSTLYLLPDPTTLSNSYSALAPSISSLNAVSLPLTTSLTSYQTDITNLNASPSFLSVVNKLRTSLSQLQSNLPADLVGDLSNTYTVLNSLSNQINSLIQSIQYCNAAVDAVTGPGNSTNPNLSISLSIVNSSLPHISCASSMFNQLSSMSASAITFPTAVSNLLARKGTITLQLNRLNSGRFQQDIINANASIPAVANSVRQYPNALFNSILNSLNSLSAQLSSFPNCSIASQELAALSSSFSTQLSDGYLAQLQTQLPTFTTSVNSASTDVNNFANALTTLQNIINAFPTSFSSYSTYSTSLSNLASSIISSGTISASLAQLLPGQPVADPVKTQILGQIQSYQQLEAAAPPVSTLLTNINGLQSALTGAQSASGGTVTASLNNLQSAATALNDTTPVYNVIQLVYVDNTTSPLQQLLTGVPHRNLNSSILSLPNLLPYSSQVHYTAGNASAQSSSLNEMQNQVAGAQGFMSAADLVSLDATINALTNLQQNFPDMVAPIYLLQLGSNALQSAADSMSNYYSQYYVARQTTVFFKNHIDWLRLLGYMLILFVPIGVVLCGLIGWWKQKSILHLYMGMCSFSVGAIFFIMCGIQLLPAILLADQCVDVNGFLIENFSQYSLGVHSLQPWYNLSAPVSAGDLFQYFSGCSIPPPQLLDLFQTPQQILTQNNINFTAYQVSIQRTLNNNNNIVGLTPRSWNYLYKLEQDTQDIVRKIMCSQLVC